MKEANVISLNTLTPNKVKNLEYDVVVIGSGPGGGLSALRSCERGLKVAVFEMGPGLKTNDFVMDEAWAYKNLYQEAAGRTTMGGEVTILQGRTLGGGSAINWTGSFETPDTTLRTWQEKHSLSHLNRSSLQKNFEKVKELIGVGDWEIPPNLNNELLALGCKKLGIPFASIPRNVRGCQNLGYCGFGCPTGAKQSSFRTSLARASELGAEIFTDAFVKRLIIKNDVIEAMEVCPPSENLGDAPVFRVVAKKFICAAGAIGTPGLLLRSNVPNPHHLLGKRTFLHPTTICGATFEKEVEPFYGAPQTIYSDAFIPQEMDEKKAGYKLEVPPIHPLLLATSLPLKGNDHRLLMERLAFTQAIIALQRDGFHRESPGGQVLIKNGQVFLDYELTPYMQEGFKRSFLTMGEIQFAAGAQYVFPVHRHGEKASSWQSFKKQVEKLSMTPLDLKVVSAHVMGGCAMGQMPQASVTDLKGRYHQIENLYVRDGSLFPTSLGTNPMLSILALVDYLEEQ
jgi:choline dehydrogenase-like flavoprotein